MKNKALTEKVLAGEVNGKSGTAWVALAACAVPLFFWPFHYEHFIFPKWVLLSVLMLPVLSGALRSLLEGEGHIILDKPSSVILLAFLGLIVATFFSSQKWMSAGYLFHFFLLVAAYFTARKAPLALRKKLEKWMPVTLALVLIYGWVQYFNLDPVSWNKAPTIARVFSTLGNTSWMASFLSLATLFVFFSFSSRERFFFLKIFVVVFSVFLIFLSGSRGATLSLLAGLAINYLPSKLSCRAEKKHGPSLFLIIALLFLLFGSAEIVSAVSGYPSLLHKFIQPGKQFLNDRLLVWQVALDMFFSSPIAGHGPGAFGFVYQQAMKEVLSRKPEFVSYSGAADHAHCDFLELLAEGGLIAGLPVILFLLLILKEALKRRNEPYFQAPVAVVAGFLTGGLVSFPLSLPSDALLFFIMAGIISQEKDDGIKIRMKAFPFAACFLFIVMLYCYFKFTLRPLVAGYYEQEGELKLMAGELASAENYLLVARNWNPVDGRILYMLGNVYLLTGRLEQARSFLENSRMFITERNALNNLGIIAEREGKLEEAREYFSLAFSLAPGRSDSVLHLANLGRVLIKAGGMDNLAKAEEVLWKAYELDPYYPEIYTLLARIPLKERKKFKEAVDTMLTLSPEEIVTGNLQRGVTGVNSQIAAEFLSKLKELCHGYSKWETGDN